MARYVNDPNSPTGRSRLLGESGPSTQSSPFTESSKRTVRAALRRIEGDREKQAEAAEVESERQDRAKAKRRKSERDAVWAEYQAAEKARKAAWEKLYPPAVSEPTSAASRAVGGSQARPAGRSAAPVDKGPQGSSPEALNPAMLAAAVARRMNGITAMASAWMAEDGQTLDPAKLAAAIRRRLPY